MYWWILAAHILIFKVYFLSWFDQHFNIFDSEFFSMYKWVDLIRFLGRWQIFTAKVSLKCRLGNAPFKGIVHTKIDIC